MRPDRELGHKIGPRLVSLIVQAVIATRRGLADHEATVRAAGTQTLIDRAGEELADLYRPIITAALASDEVPIHPLVRDFLEQAIAGTHQYHAIGGLLFGGASSVLSTVISNALAPIGYHINEMGPSLDLDPQTAAQAYAAGIVSQGDAFSSGAQQGFSSGPMTVLAQLAQQIPDAGQLGDAMNRGLLSEAQAAGWLHRAAIPRELQAILLELRHALLPADQAALAVLRGNLDLQAGEAYAAKAGYSPAEFAVLVANTGEPPGLMQLLEAYRRGIIDKARLERGIRQSRVRDEWIATVEGLRYTPMPTADAADAALRGHLSIAEAEAIALQNGLEPAQWPAYYANQGNPPAPEQLLELWRRGYIDQGTVDRGLREGRTRDEWIPQMRELRYEPISSADAVDAWLRGHIDQAAAEKLMAENGLLPRDHGIALANAGNPLPLEQLLEAYRRKMIDGTRFEHGFRESRYRDEWLSTALELRYHPMSTADAIEAAVQGHLTLPEAEGITQENGLSPGSFTALYQTAGAPLSRTELEQLYNRGIIDQATVVQGLRESRLKDKYIPAALELHTRLPEARQIVTMLEFGAIDQGAAIEELQHLGYTDTIAAAIVNEGLARSTGGHRQLATAQIINLYESKILTTDQATPLLEALHYTPETIGLLLQLAEHTRRMRILDTGLTAVKKQYLAYRLDDTEATADLTALAIPADAIALYLATWQIERRGATRGLTEAQIVKAHKLGLFNTPDDPAGDDLAAARLAQLGYSDQDAALLLAGA